jgi:D-lactate dehydrogenase (cytochrome)
VPTRVATRRPSSRSSPPSSPDVSGVLEDAAHYPGGHATAIVRPGSIDELSAALRRGERLLPIGAQSSLTGGATPFGDTVVVTGSLTGIQTRSDRVAVGAGVPLQTLQNELAKTGRWFPPVPTYLGAFAGGAVATGAAGAATFKYGTVREWVDGLTIVLAGGDVLSLSRGEFLAGDDGFAIETSTGVRTFRIPDIRMPDVPKRSAGYFLAPKMDLIDLFIGSEGTLGVIAEAVFKTAALPAAVCRALVPVPSEPAAIELVGALRAAAPASIDVAAIEHLDARSIAVIREDGIDRKLDIALPSGAAVVLLIDLELPPTGVTELWQQLEGAREPGGDSPLLRFCRMLDRFGVLDDTEVALPGDRARAAAFAELREAVPAGVNRRVALARQADATISKTAADMIVPFERFGEMMRIYREEFGRRGLDFAVWGHISDGNVHPNVLPRSYADVERGKEAILFFGREATRLGGCPLAEHGVGRNPVKQALLRELYGDAGLDQMRAIKRALDPAWKLAPGVTFSEL